MKVPNDISSCHRIILELASAIEVITPQLAGCVQKTEAQLGQIVLLKSRLKELATQISQNNRTCYGAEIYARVQSFTSSLRKHSMNVFQNLINAFDRKAINFQAG